MAGIRLRNCAMALLLAFTTSSLAQQPPPANSPPILTNRASDSYAIYSLLLSGGTLRDTSPHREQHLAIADETVSFEDMTSAAGPDGALEPPSESASAFQEVQQDFRTRRQERAQLEHRFKLDRPYTLVSANEVAEFLKGPQGAASSSAAGYGNITRFSEVYFNTAQTAAMVYVDQVCATPCANGQWVYLEKRDGQWVRRSGPISDRADTYAIYSLLMPGVPFESMSTAQAQRFAIAGTTVSIEQMNPAIPPDGQLQPPPNNAQAFREAVQDFQTRRYERIQLEHQIKIDRPYTLLAPDDVGELKMTLAGIDPGSQLQAKWAGYPGITYFSEVYFNTAHTAALVYMNNFCANLCANGQWIYLEKNSDQWVRRSGLNI
ncbi:MAG TPA: hypothetical protein VH139_09985 [Acidobacteriaceae bacterium]|nr:hypothetical protein [Acidobacteriaceae bacterium]